MNSIHFRRWACEQGFICPFGSHWYHPGSDVLFTPRAMYSRYMGFKLDPNTPKT